MTQTGTTYQDAPLQILVDLDDDDLLAVLRGGNNPARRDLRARLGTPGAPGRITQRVTDEAYVIAFDRGIVAAEDIPQPLRTYILARQEAEARFAADAVASQTADAQPAPALLPTQLATYTDGPVSLVAMLYNRIEMPLMAFESREAALAHLAPHGVEFADGETRARVDPDALGIDWENPDAPRKPLIDALFGPGGFYDDGNGGVDSLVLRPFAFGSPMAMGLDLD